MEPSLKGRLITVCSETSKRRRRVWKAFDLVSLARTISDVGQCGKKIKGAKKIEKKSLLCKHGNSESQCPEPM